MKLRVFLAILLCRTLRFISRILHRGGTALPGRWALKLCPELLSYLSRDVKTIAITGTNGKTTCARMVEQAFSDAGLSYFSNRSGANLIDGITTEFVMNSSFGGKPLKSCAVIECDEAASRRVFPQLKPQAVIVTNLFSDQLDRFGDVTHTLESIREALKATPETVMCLNADCSLTSSLAKDLPNRAVFFGFEKGAVPSKPLGENVDAKHCLYCRAEYDYDYTVYGHLGGFHCPKCGYGRHKADYAVTDVPELLADSSSAVIEIKGKKHLVKINLPALYNIYNAAAALAGACEMGIDAGLAVSALGSFKCGFGRLEHFDLGRRGTKMMLVKNPAGCNLVIDYLENIKEKFALVICINDRAGDGTDISWLWDTDFERLCSFSGRLDGITVTGDRAEDMRVRLKYAGIEDRFITVEKNYDNLVSRIGKQDRPVFIMPNYTAMLDARSAIVKHCGGTDFWE